MDQNTGVDQGLSLGSLEDGPETKANTEGAQSAQSAEASAGEGGSVIQHGTEAGASPDVANSCEGCGKPATKMDADGNRLCEPCFLELVASRRNARAAAEGSVQPTQEQAARAVRIGEIRARLATIGENPHAERDRVNRAVIDLREEAAEEARVFAAEIAQGQQEVLRLQEVGNRLECEKRDLEKELARLEKAGG